MHNKRTSITALCCGILLSCYTPNAIAADHNHAADKPHQDNGAVLLPQQMSTARSFYIAPAQATNAKAWSTFTGQNGQWTVLLDKTTGTPHEAFGSPVRIPGYDRITESNIEQAAEAFLRSHSDILKVDPDQVRLINKTFVNNRWYVSYVQTVGGVDVLLSEVRLRIFANGNVIAFGADYYPALKPLAPASLSWQAAAAQAGTGLQAPTTPALSVLPSNATSLFVLPLKQQDAIDYHLVYKVPVRSGYDSYVAYVDAHTGDVLWRYTTSHDAATEVTSQGGIHAVTPMDDETMVGFQYQYVTVGGQQYTTDAEGKLNININAASEINATLDGPYAVVRRSSGTNASFSGTVQPGTPATIAWNDENSNTFERNMFYHANAIRSFFKGIDPALTAMDRPLYVDLQYGGSEVNAYSNGDSIVFLAVDDASARMAQGPSVLYHEYGHSVNDLLYRSLGRDGMVNMACHEGTADVVSTLLLDDPRIGYGVFTDEPERFIRNVQNDMIYPDSSIGESHNDGLILAGAFWDLRNSVSLEYARRIAHFARYGTPDDPDDGIAFRRWFVETLIADDDDGNLANGTPHMMEIVTAFNRHHIGSNLLLAQGFSHEPYADTKETATPYELTFELGAGGLAGAMPDSVSIVYSTDNFVTTMVVPAQANIGDNTYRSSIPAQPKGTIVEYYIRAWDVLGKTMLRFAADASAKKPYIFLVGYSVSVDENFEQERGWTIGGNNDNAQTGRWERAIPQEIDFRDFGGFYLQPGTDHSGSGRCFVTGAKGGFSFQQGILAGKTTITSPKYDLSVFENPVIRLYRWFANMNLTGGTLSTAFFRTEISTDDGATWTGIDTIKDGATEWEKVIIRIPEAAQTSQNFRVRFVANAPLNQTAEEARFVKALVDDVNILTTNEVVADVLDNTETAGRLVSAPNPFSSTTTLRYAVEKAGAVRMTVYSLTGTEVATLANGYSAPGDYAIEWNGTDNAGNKVAPGVYVVRYQTGDLVMSRTLVHY